MTKGLRLALLGCVLSGAVILLAGGRDWARVEYGGPARTATGHELVGTLVPWGLVALAGVVAIAATRRWGRVPVGLALAACGSLVAAICLDLIRSTEVRAWRATGDPGIQTLPAWPVHETAWPWVTLAAGALLAATGLLVALRGPGWAGLGARYDAPAARPRSAADLWEALDRGEDPTT